MKNIIFISVIVSLLTFGVIIPDKDMSEQERRPLQQFPSFSVEAFMEGEFQKEFQEYVSDQFPFRDWFRGVKTWINHDLLNRIDNNNVYIKDDNIYDKFEDINYDMVDTHIRNINKLIEQFENGVYLTLIPSKSYGVDLPVIDQEILASYISNNIDAIYFDQLSYYDENDAFLVTDPHWTQTAAKDIYKDYLQKHLIKQNNLSTYKKYMLEDPYQGTLYSNLGSGSYEDYLEYYTNDVIENLEVCITGIETVCQTGPYFESDNLYDLYLNGNHPIVEIYNDSVEEKELVVFRDSFSNAIAPFIAEDYSKVTLIDLRLVHHSYVLSEVDFANADVLFMYNMKTMNDDFRLTN